MSAIEAKPQCYGCGETDCLCETQPCAYCSREAVCRNGMCSEACQDMASEVAEIVHRAWDADTSGLLRFGSLPASAGV